MNEHNYRTWIQERYAITSRSKAEALYAAKFRPIFPELNSKVIRQRSALIHCTYQISIIFFTFGVVSIFTRSSGYYLSFLALSALFLLSAILGDLQIDRQVYVTLDVSKAKCDRAAAAGGYKAVKS